MRDRWTRHALLAAFVFVTADAATDAAEIEGRDRAAGDAAVERVLARLAVGEGSTGIEVLAAQRETNPVTGYSYTIVKARVGQQDKLAVLNESTGAFALDPELPAREVELVLSKLSPSYRKMGWGLLSRVRLEQGGTLGAEQGHDAAQLDVTIYASSKEKLAAIETALGAARFERFDVPALFEASPSVLRPSKDGAPPAADEAPQVRALFTTLPLRELIRIAALDAVLHVEITGRKEAKLDVSVPRIRANTTKGYGLDGFDADIAVIDTGVDNTHPDINFVIAERDWTNDGQLCIGGANHGAVCNCGPAGACVAAACVGGALAGMGCVAACAGPGVCEGPEDDRSAVGHGTHVCGIAVNSSGGFAGMAPFADVISAKVLSGGALSGKDPTIFTAMAWTTAPARGADILNLSLGGAPTPGASNGQDPTSRQADFEAFVNNKTVCIASAETPDVGPIAPADGYNVIAVGATNLAVGASTEASFQVPGPTTDGRSKPDVSAPGESPGVDGIDSTAHDWEGVNPDFRDLQGTSMATPHVSGLAAQIWDWGTNHSRLIDTPYIKASILNNANRLAAWTRPSVSQPLDPQQGTGEVEAVETFRAYADDLRVWQQRVTGTAPKDSHWYWVDVTGAPIPLVTTLVWERHVTNSEAVTPGVLAPTVNDLDLRLFDPNGVLLDRSVSVRDSVEHIVFPVPANGRYCVEVDPFTLQPSPNNSDLYALAASRPPTGNIRDFRLNFLGNVNPCIPDFGDAPDPLYPTLLASNGARHLDWTKEWLGTSRPEIDGELQKGTLAVVSSVDPFPSVSGERDATDPADQDGVVNLTDHDFYDDGVLIPGPFFPLVPKVVSVTVQTTVDDTGVGPLGRYDATVPTKRLYLNAWADWNGNGSWADAGEKIIGTGSPTGQVAVDPATFGANGRYTVGETFTDSNGSGYWEQGETFLDAVGATEKTFTFVVTPPLLLAADFYLRFRVDYGEDVGVVANVSGTLAQEKGAAQFGEVEDYRQGHEIDAFQATLAQIDVRMPPASTTPHLIDLTGPSIVDVDLGSLSDPDLNGREQVSTRMQLLQLEGDDSTFGHVIVRLRDPGSEPFLPTVGEIEENSNVHPGTLDLDPFTTSPPNLSADSYFNVYFEVELPNLGITLHNHTRKRMKGRIYHKPPRVGDPYISYEYVTLYDSLHNVVAAAGPSYHIPNKPPRKTEYDLFAASTARVDIRMPAGNPVPHFVDLSGPTAVQVDLGGLADTDGNLKEQVTTEMFDLDLSGTDPDFGTVLVRRRSPELHPFQHTLGEIEENTNVFAGVLDVPPFTMNPPNLTAQSYFNVYFEVELPGLGLRLHTHQPKRMSGTIRNKPPAEGDKYQSPLFVTLYDDLENTIAEVGPGEHVANTGCSVTCNDHNECTHDNCNPDGPGCVYSPVVCNDGNPCTDDSCSPGVGGCIAIQSPNGQACEDGNACTSSDSCSGGTCLSGPLANCDDGNPCTDDGCNPASGCSHEFNTLPCNDLNQCTTGDACAGGACQPGIPGQPEVTGVRAPNKQGFQWTPSTLVQQYQVVRGSLAQLPVGPGGADEQCIFTSPNPQVPDPTVPAIGNGLFYLVRGNGPCGIGPYGRTHVNPGLQLNGPQRTTATCP